MKPSIRQRGGIKTRLLILASLLFVITGAGVLWWRAGSPAEPSYLGQRASLWFDRLADPTNDWSQQQLWLERESATDLRALSFRHDLDAFRQMGPAAAPFLAKRLRARPADSSARYQWIFAHMPVWLQRAFPRVRTAEQDRRTADLILKQLGPDAYPAVPDFIQMITKGDDREQLEAVNILKEIGLSASNAVPALGGLLRGSDLFLRVAAADALCHIEPANTAPMIQVMRDALLSKEKSVKVLALDTLWKTVRKPEYVLPALIPMLSEKDSAIFACKILKQCGPSASNAVPSLVAQLDSPKLELRVAAASTLLSVDKHVEPHKVAGALAEGKAAGLVIYGLSYDTAGN